VRQSEGNDLSLVSNHDEQGATKATLAQKLGVAVNGCGTGVEWMRLDKVRFREERAFARMAAIGR